MTVGWSLHRSPVIHVAGYGMNFPDSRCHWSDAACIAMAERMTSNAGSFAFLHAVIAEGFETLRG
jgi:hypothetical protein